MRRSIVPIAVFGLLVATCSNDPTATPEYQSLQQQLTEVRAKLAGVTAHRDELAAAVATTDHPSKRYEKSLATQQGIQDILDHPEWYGTEDKVVDLLSSYATTEAMRDDAVFGAIDMRNAWHNTLYEGSMDAEIDTSFRWLSDDGSQGGVLWLWHGTNLDGNPFELAGMSLDTYDRNGSITHAYVVYPYSDAYVREAVYRNGTARSEADVSRDDVFVFGEDDLCEWVTEDEVTGFARDAYAAVGIDWTGSATLSREHWVESNYEFECEWSLPRQGPTGSINVYTVPVSLSRGGLIAYEDLTDPFIPIGGTVTEHPDFDNHVMINNHAFGRYGFWTPASDTQLVLSVNLGRDIDLDEDEQWETPLFVVANGFLKDMAWTP